MPSSGRTAISDVPLPLPPLLLHMHVHVLLCRHAQAVPPALPCSASQAFASAPPWPILPAVWGARAGQLSLDSCMAVGRPAVAAAALGLQLLPEDSGGMSSEGASPAGSPRAAACSVLSGGSGVGEHDLESGSRAVHFGGAATIPAHRPEGGGPPRPASARRTTSSNIALLKKSAATSGSSGCAGAAMCCSWRSRQRRGGAAGWALAATTTFRQGCSVQLAFRQAAGDPYAALACCLPSVPLSP